jgi:hypothetical protein
MQAAPHICISIADFGLCFMFNCLRQSKTPRLTFASDYSKKRRGNFIIGLKGQEHVMFLTIPCHLLIKSEN